MSFFFCFCFFAPCHLVWGVAFADLGYNSFGAVIEEFEVRDALLALFAEKDTGAPVRGQLFAPQEVPVYA